MINLKSYDEFLFEDSPMYTHDGSLIKVGKSVISFDGYSGIIVSKEIVNGRIQYRDHKGVIRVCESCDLIDSEELNEADLTWIEVTKGILAADSIKTGVSFAGGGLSLGSILFSKWRNSIANKIEKIKKDDKYNQYKDEATKIANKFNSDTELNLKIAELSKYPFRDITFITGKREKSKAIENNKTRTDLMREIAKYIKSKLSEDEKKFFAEINAILKDSPLINDEGKKIEEDVVSDPNRTVGTGTLTAVSPADQNFGVQGSRNSNDAIGVDTIART